MTTFPATYCPHCGTALGRREVDGRERRWCSSCERVVWHTPVPTAGVAVVGPEGVLLTKRAIEPGSGTWSIPGGHLEADEPPEEAAARELAEETGVQVAADDVDLLDQFVSDHGDGKHIVSIGFMVERTATAGVAAPGREVTDVGWFTPDTFGEGGEVLLEPHESRFEQAWAWFEERGDG